MFHLSKIWNIRELLLAPLELYVVCVVLCAARNIEPHLLPVANYGHLCSPLNSDLVVRLFEVIDLVVML
jgi:hypothetical protein